MYLRTFIIKKFGTATKIVWLPKAWGFQKGDLVHIEAKINKTTYHDTNYVKAGSQGACYVTLPPFWPCDVGDMISLGIVYATVSERPANADTGAEDQKAD